MSGEEIVIIEDDADTGIDSHLTYDQVELWVDGRSDSIDRELVEGHIELCQLCRNEIADLARVRDTLSATPARARRSRARWLPAAAIVVIALVGSLLLFRDDAGSPPLTVDPRPAPVQPPSVPGPTETPATATQPPPLPALVKPAIVAALVRDVGRLRGDSARGAFALHQPVGTVVLDTRPRFRWAAVPGAHTYAVVVADHETGRAAAAGSSTTTSWRPPASLNRGRTYAWQVTAHRGEERTTVPQPADPEALFHIATRHQAVEIEALPEDHLARGIALARLGVLDEAERELQLALDGGKSRAKDLLEEVHSWRQSARPTRTNGAQ